ncbi:PTS transporter subunit EIIC [Bombilactobacillus bombi]|nr:PTS transporter subunit EIIC [Bombilactobacillus bombi]
MNDQKIAQEILSLVGGSTNINKVWHCATRLRIVPINMDIIDRENLKKISGVLGVVINGEQVQIVIGNHVSDVYHEFTSLLNNTEDLHKTRTIDKVQNKNTTSNKNLISSILSAIVGCITPLIPVLVAGGMGKCLILMAKMFNLISDKSITYQIILLIFDSAFYFLPVFVSLAAAKQFNTNSYLAAMVGCTLLNPTFVKLVASGKALSIFGMPVMSIPYNSTIIPSIMAIWVMSYVKRFLDKYLWASIKSFMSPLLTIIIIVPMTMIIIGPAMTAVSVGISKIIFFLSSKLGPLTLALLALIYPWIVTTGMHSALAIAGLDSINKTGIDPLTRALVLMHNITQAAATLAVAIKTKNTDFRGTAISASLTALFSGITEPCLYGVTLRLHKPMYACA